jgi:hypothetical protein
MIVSVDGFFTMPVLKAQRVASRASSNGRDPTSLTTLAGHSSADAIDVAATAFADDAGRSDANAATAISTTANPTCALRARRDTLDKIEIPSVEL